MPVAQQSPVQSYVAPRIYSTGFHSPVPQGFVVGPPLKSALAKLLPGLVTIAVPYAASIGTNVSADRTDAKSKAIGVQTFQKAAGCEVIVAGGYSQGAAVMHNALGTVNGKKSPLSAEIRNKIAGVALFGDTRNKQDAGHIKDFPTERSRVWCHSSDGVCGGALNVNGGHLSYSTAEATEAAKWLAGLAKSFKGGKSGDDDSSSGGEATPTPKKKKSKGKAHKETPPPAAEETPDAPAAETPAADAPAAEVPAEEATPKKKKTKKTKKASSGGERVVDLQEGPLDEESS